MDAPVDDAVHPAVLGARDDDRDLPDVRRLVVTGEGDLGLVAEIHPGAVEDAPHLLREHVGVGVDRGVDAPARSPRAS